MHGYFRRGYRDRIHRRNRRGGTARAYHSGFRSEARQRVASFVDDRATRQETDALVAAFTGSFGGPLRELADLMGEVLALESAPIALRREGRLTTLMVGKRCRGWGDHERGPIGTSYDTHEWKVEQSASGFRLTGWTWICADAAR